MLAHSPCGCLCPWSKRMCLPGSADVKEKIHVGPQVLQHVEKRKLRAEGRPPAEGAGKLVGCVR